MWGLLTTYSCLAQSSLQTLTDFDLVQNVTGATYTAGHTLDVFITRSGMQTQVTVAGGGLSRRSSQTIQWSQPLSSWTRSRGPWHPYHCSTQPAIVRHRCLQKRCSVDWVRTSLLIRQTTATISSLCTTALWSLCWTRQAHTAEADGYSLPTVSTVVQCRM